MLLLAVSIVANVLVLNRAIMTNSDERGTADSTDIRASKPIVISVTLDTRDNQESSSKLPSRAASMTPTTIMPSTTTSTTTSSTTSSTTTTTITSTLPSICSFLDCMTEPDPSESESSYESDAFWDSSDYEPTTEDDDSDWGFNWGN